MPCSDGTYTPEHYSSASSLNEEVIFKTGTDSPDSSSSKISIIALRRWESDMKSLIQSGPGNLSLSENGMSKARFDDH